VLKKGCFRGRAGTDIFLIERGSESEIVLRDTSALPSKAQPVQKLSFDRFFLLSLKLSFKVKCRF